jgi:hypothetical protein
MVGSSHGLVFAGSAARALAGLATCVGTTSVANSAGQDLNKREFFGMLAGR